jgi:hypothetical protein
MGTGGIPTTDNIPETIEKLGYPTDNIPDNRFFEILNFIIFIKNKTNTCKNNNNIIITLYSSVR